MRNLLQSAAESFIGFFRFIGWVVLYCATFAGLLLILFDVAHYLFFSSDFTVQEISITPTEWVDREEILSRVSLTPGTNIWLVNREKMQEQLKDHPIIREAVVQRIPPRRIHIVIEERIPVVFALHPEDGQLYGLDREGVILPPLIRQDLSIHSAEYLEKQLKRIQTCPLITGAIDLQFWPGEAEPDPRMKPSLQMMQRLRNEAPQFFGELAEVEWKEDDNLYLHPRRRIGVIVLRDMSDRELSKKIAAFWRVLEEKNLRAIYVDARFPDKGFAVRFDESDGDAWKQLYQAEESYLTQSLQAAS